MNTISQASLATAIGLSTAGIWVGTQQPNRSPRKVPVGGDSIRMLVDLHQRYGYLIDLLLGGVALQHISLVSTYPNTPASLLRHAAANGLDMRYVTWSKETAIPIALILFVGVPLRTISYGNLGKNFTFGLSTPDRLNTGGLYRYMQHPSYTGLLALFAGMIGLWGRVDGILSCFIPPWLFQRLRRLELVALSLPMAMIITLGFRRVKDEEQLLRRQFGSEWEDWHSRTARFIPFIF
ncbi:hypothetical protein F4861DRAFT_166627 [Xylaria intraflava]|nr:hypothetical protein F4861DRAFT_166627 [Xylaria intraflava]